MEKNTNSRTFKVIITGPESSGKSTLSQQLSEHFNSPWLPEFAREYLKNLHGPYQESDLLEIAKGQLKKEDESLSSNPKILFIDTSLLVLKVWSEWKYKRCASFISNKLKEQYADMYLLMSPDIPWQEDSLRENPNDRDALFEVYENELKVLNVNYYIISGSGMERKDMAIETIQNKLEQLQYK